MEPAWRAHYFLPGAYVVTKLGSARWSGVVSVVSREAVLGLRFGLVGAAATILHILAVVAVIGLWGISALQANVAAFSLAVLVSFLGNYYWTFGEPGRPMVALSRFIFIALVGFLVNNAALAVVLDRAWFSPVLASVCCAAIVPVVSFAGSRLWGFRPGSPDRV